MNKVQQIAAALAVGATLAMPAFADDMMNNNMNMTGTCMMNCDGKGADCDPKKAMDPNPMTKEACEKMGGKLDMSAMPNSGATQ